MTDDQPAAPGHPGFVRGNERLDQLLADPQLTADVAAAHADAEEMDRVYAMNLAMIRKAAQMTQVEVARKLGVGQGVVSRLEHRDDMLLSTLYDYLMATGAEGASIVVVVHGHRIELDLSGVRNAPPEQQSALSSHRPCHVILPRSESPSRLWARPECLRSVTVTDHCAPSAWNVSWNGLANSSTASAVSAIIRAISAASACAARSRASPLCQTRLRHRSEANLY
jgi:DNA-binding transcriptional regulator YiaG